MLFVVQELRDWTYHLSEHFHNLYGAIHYPFLDLCIIDLLPCMRNELKITYGTLVSQPLNVDHYKAGTNQNQSCSTFRSEELHTTFGHENSMRVKLPAYCQLKIVVYDPEVKFVDALSSSLQPADRW